MGRSEREREMRRVKFLSGEEPPPFHSGVISSDVNLSEEYVSREVEAAKAVEGGGWLRPSRNSRTGAHVKENTLPLISKSIRADFIHRSF